MNSSSLVSERTCLRRARALIALSLPLGSVSGQTTDTPSPRDEIVELSPFAIRASTAADRYAPAEAISGGHVRTTIFDGSQNISVVTGELLGDVAAIRILDGAKYVAGVTESTIPNGLDRITIRGFQTSSRTLDGITTVAQSNLEPVLIERLEIVKGPNAILAPAGTPGGTINAVSKKPFFANRNTISAEVGRFDSQRAELDVNRVVGSRRKLAVRLLGAVQESDDWWGLPKKLRILAPMVTYRFSPTTEFTWQTHSIDWRITNYNGISIDPTAGTTNEAKLYQGIPRDLNIFGPDSFRGDGRVENTYWFSSKLADGWSLRLQGRHSNVFRENFATTNLAGASTAAGVNSDSFNPLTGDYTPGMVYARTPPYAATPVTISRTFNRSGQIADLSRLNYDQQIDLLHVGEPIRGAKTETLIGGAYGYLHETDLRHALTAPAVTLEHFVLSANVVGAVSRNQVAVNRTFQAYCSERLTLLHGRLIVNGGYSRNRFDLSTNDLLGKVNAHVIRHVDLFNYGVVAKPVPDVALFYNFAENAAPLPTVNIAAGGPSTQDGTQREGGVRLQFLNGRLRATGSYYHAKQNNVSVANPGNFAFPPPVPSLPTLLSNRVAHGVEFELQGSITDDLSVMAAFTKYRNRNPFGQEFRGNAEKAWSAFVHYRLPNAVGIRGLSIGVGVDYLGKRPGDDASGFTPAGVKRKPTFYLPARTLTNLTLTYAPTPTWTAQLNVDNVFNQEYLAASLGRGIVWPGTSTNIKARVMYAF